MNGRVLVAYATRAGSTAEVAEAIGKTLAELGAEVDVRRVQDVRGVQGYDAVIVGSAARANKLLPEAVGFARSHRETLGKLRTAYFTTGVAMVEDTPKNRATATSYLKPLCEVREPVGLGLFAGKVDHTKLLFHWRLMLSFVKEGIMADGDHRDWGKIEAWAREVAPVLLEQGGVTDRAGRRLAGATPC